MDNAKNFDGKSSKKRVLNSEQSETGDEQKNRKREVEINLQPAL